MEVEKIEEKVGRTTGDVFEKRKGVPYGVFWNVLNRDLPLNEMMERVTSERVELRRCFLTKIEREKKVGLLIYRT